MYCFAWVISANNKKTNERFERRGEQIGVDMKKKILKILLILIIVLTELWIGYSFLSNYYNTRQIQGRFDNNQKVTQINKDNLVFPELGQYKYYWEYQANTTETIDVDWLSYQPVYHHNDDGLNDMSDYPVEKSAASFRIITLGDSFTDGAFVNTQDNWPEQLEKLLNKKSTNYCAYEDIEVINLGMGGFDVPYLVERYKRIGQKYNPDLIIWFEAGSGFNRLVELLMPLLEVCGREASEEQKNSWHYYCWDEAQKKIDSSYDREAINKIILQSLGDFYQLINFETQKVIFFGYNNINEAENNVLRQWQDKYPLFNFSFSLRRDYGVDQSKYYLPDNHPSAAGHKEIAQHIFEYLQKNEFADCGEKSFNEK